MRTQGDSLGKSNYTYDSSVVPVKTELYGIPDAGIRPYRISSKSIEKDDESGRIIEFPILVTKFLGKKIPAGGGFYLRTLPTKIIKNAIKNSNVKVSFDGQTFAGKANLVKDDSLNKKISQLKYKDEKRASEARIVLEVDCI